jgi:hypothetical protein
MTESLWTGAQLHGESISAEQAEARIRQYQRQLEEYHNYQDLLAYRLERKKYREPYNENIMTFPRWWVRNVIFFPIAGFCRIVDLLSKGQRR